MALLVIPVLLALTGHEFAHAWAANALGDDTAKRAGRLTFNPLVHLDFMGTVFLLFTQVCGWAKPLPVNPRNFRWPPRDMALVAMAGPALNIIWALIMGLVLKTVFQAGLFYNQMTYASTLFQFVNVIVWINLALGIFNLLPLPPLDGFQILAAFLPASWSRYFTHRGYYLISLVIFMCLAYFGVFSRLIRPLANGFFSFIYS
jgi:Zn-dependent protease